MYVCMYADTYIHDEECMYVSDYVCIYVYISWNDPLLEDVHTIYMHTYTYRHIDRMYNIPLCVYTIQHFVYVQ